MTEALANMFGTLLGAGLYLFAATRSLLSDLWKLLLISETPARQRAARTIFLLCAFPVMACSLLLLGISNFPAACFLAATIVPAVAWKILVYWGWRTDSLDDRSAALAIAIERAERFSKNPPTHTQRFPWKDYLYDVETARRRERYEPPPI